MKSFLSPAARALLDGDVDTIKQNLKKHRENRFLSYIFESSNSSSSNDHDLEDMIIEEEFAYINSAFKLFTRTVRLTIKKLHYALK